MSNSDSNSRQDHQHHNSQNNTQNDPQESSAHVRPAHQNFHWIEGDARNTPYANFIETTLDISSGLHTCLQIVYASELERAANLDADAGQTAAPAVGVFEADQLLRLSIATSGLLRDAARQRVELLNAEAALE
jgi:hypothetical protein